MGGIRFSNNFLGLGAVKAVINTGIENVIYIAPVFTFFLLMGKK